MAKSDRRTFSNCFANTIRENTDQCMIEWKQTRDPKTENTAFTNKTNKNENESDPNKRQLDYLNSREERKKNERIK